jgi:hypothetical protein
VLMPEVMPHCLKFICVLEVLLGAAIVSAPAEAQDLPSRVAIDLLYLKDADPAVIRTVKDWADAIDYRLELSIRYDDSLKMPRQGLIRARPIERAVPLTRHEMETYWRNTGAVQVAFGRGTRVGNSIQLKATVYLGQLQGSLPSPIVPLSHTIAPGNYRDASNLMMAIALYALGVDATAVPAIACILFARAHRFARAVPPGLESSAVMRQAISAELIRHRCETRRR